MIRTRFNPTVNGPLHMGHVYTMKVNEHFAHSQGGAFIIRFDDRSPTSARLSLGERMQIVSQQLEDIEWLGIQVDEWYTESDLVSEIAETMANLEDAMRIYEEPHGEYRMPTFVEYRGTGWEPIPPIPRQTAERVMLDHMQGITHLIRGNEWCTETSLYVFYCRILGYPEPEFIFLPRLQNTMNQNISKTAGGYTLQEFQELFTAEELLEKLRSDVGGWDIKSLYRKPHLWI